jgi:anaerobic magnesium-protoporphyrin IX monomethyl ester cyclase
MARRSGIKTMSYFILGIPVESYDEALHTIDFAKRIKTDFAQFSILSPFPGTRL